MKKKTRRDTKLRNTYCKYFRWFSTLMSNEYRTLKVMLIDTKFSKAGLMYQESIVILVVAYLQRVGRAMLMVPFLV